MTDRDDTGRFLTGSNGGPGRPKGSRNRLSEAFIAALCDDFDQHGAAAIERTRVEDPVAYVRVLASILPRQIRVEDELREMSDEDLARRIEQFAGEFGLVRAAVTSTPLLIEGEPSDAGEGDAG